MQALLDLNEQELRKLTLLQANVRGHLARKQQAAAAAASAPAPQGAAPVRLPARAELLARLL